jgi:hypothetical protein
MAELEITAYLHGLLVDIAARRVLTNPHDCAAYLELPGDPPADVSRAVWLLEQAGLVREPVDSVVWELTNAGERARDAGPTALIDQGEGLLT